MTGLRASIETTLNDVPKGLLMGGSWGTSTTSRTLPVENPATGEVLAHVADACVADGLQALGAAHAARESWAETPARERAELLRRAFELTLERADQLTVLMTLEMGKPLAESRAELAYGAEFLRWFSEEAVRLDGRYSPSPSGDGQVLVSRSPVGPCLLITPWNFPLAMATRKIAPALAAGCTVILKPAEQTPLTALAFVQILVEAGVPAGVVNVLTTSSPSTVVGPLLQDERLRKVSFTGSTAVGRELVRQSADRLLRVSMELGGNAPFIVLDDADVDAAVEGAMLAKMRNGGEACTAANRLYVHQSLAEEFADRLATRMRRLVLGDGLDPGVDVGPLIDAVQREKVAGLVDSARSAGARVVCGGSRIDGAGYFYEPTVVLDPPADAALLREEIFGPVAPIIRFTDVDEVLAAANATEYGLVAYVYSRDVGRALKLAGRLETGMLAINRGIVSNAAAPFGGVKASGLGREGGREGIEEYVETRYIALAL